MAAVPAPTAFEVERAFADAMQAAGYAPGPIRTATPGFVRFDAPGDKKGRENGFYRLTTGQYPVGWFGDWKTGQSIQWQWDHGRELTKKERDSIKAEHRRLKHEAEVAREHRQREVAERASHMWKNASTDADGHPYLTTKAIETPRGLRVHIAADGTRLLAVPMYSFDHAGVPQLVNLQLIGPDGQKRFLAGGRKERCFFALKGDSAVMVEVEGIATAFAVWEATGMSVVAAFDSGNLIAVAKEIAVHRPMATLLVAGDDDAIEPDDWAERGQGREWKNVGRVKAEATAKAIGCRWVLPVFAAGQQRGQTDFDDLKRVEGIEMVRAQIIGAIRSIDPEPGEPSAQIIEADFIQDESWRTQLPVTSSGKIDAANVEATAIYLQNHRLLRGRLSFNTHTVAIELDGAEIADHHVAEFRRIMHRDGLKARKSDVQDEMIAEARRHTHDPLADYLKNLRWDGTPRIDRWLSTYLGVEEARYTTTIGRKFLIGAVARALEPGVKHDVALILEGPQGAGKSTAMRYLFGDRFFVDNLPDFHSKDSFQQLQGFWCVEIAELSAMSKADVDDVKKFLSRMIDVYRPPFGKLPIKVPRRCVFVGTVNPEEGFGYLKDQTGARRFWPVAVCHNRQPIMLNTLLLDRDQLWAEAAEAFRKGEPWYLTERDDIEAARDEQNLRREEDPWEQAITDWMVVNFASQVTVEAMLTDVAKLPVERQDTRARRRMGSALRAVGWTAETKRPAGGKPVRMFMRPDHSKPAQPDFYLPEEWH